MLYKLVTSLVTTVLLSGCFASFPKAPEDQATYFIDKAKSAYSEGQFEASGNYIGFALDRPTGAEKVRQAFKRDLKLRKVYFDIIHKQITTIRYDWNALGVFNNIETARKASVLEESEISYLSSSLDKAIVDGNRSGSLKLTLADEYYKFPVLNTTEHYKIIVNRTIEAIIGNHEKRGYMLPQLMKHLQKAGRSSEDGKLVESLLPSMKIRRNELDIVGTIYPEFVAQRKESLTAKVNIQVKNADRLFADDAITAIKSNVRGIELVPSSDAKVTHVTIERARHDEKTIPERTETFIYSNSDVNIIHAALLMPRNASYLFDQTSGGAEIDYGYVITAVQDGKTIFDEVIRGKLGGEYRRCQNARIQNVFGGVSRADFVANDDMQRRCSGSSAVSMEDLRRQVLNKIVDGVLKVGPIQAVHELNSNSYVPPF
jgi:hypothetical protein